MKIFFVEPSPPHKKTDSTAVSVYGDGGCHDAESSPRMCWAGPSFSPLILKDLSKIPERWCAGSCVLAVLEIPISRPAVLFVRGREQGEMWQGVGNRCVVRAGGGAVKGAISGPQVEAESR